MKFTSDESKAEWAQGIVNVVKDMHAMSILNARMKVTAGSPGLIEWSGMAEPIILWYTGVSLQRRPPQ